MSDVRRQNFEAVRARLLRKARSRMKLAGLRAGFVERPDDREGEGDIASPDEGAALPAGDLGINQNKDARSC